MRLPSAYTAPDTSADGCVLMLSLDRQARLSYVTQVGTIL
jgi:hypothetical protein